MPRLGFLPLYKGIPWTVYSCRNNFSYMCGHGEIKIFPWSESNFAQVFGKFQVNSHVSLLGIITYNLLKFKLRMFYIDLGF